jgi:hypothetical protein
MAPRNYDFEILDEARIRSENEGEAYPIIAD